MSRRSKESSGSPVSLFPFLSILACMIGTLTLMITGLALTGMGVGRDNESIARAEEFVALEKQSEKVQQKLDKLHALIQKARRAAEKVADFEELLKSQNAAADLEERVVALKARNKNNAKNSAELEKELVRLKSELDSLREELAGRQQRFSKELIKVLPPKGDYTTRFKPWFVEAAKAGLTIYSGDKPYKVANSKIKTDKKFNEFLKKLAANDSSQLVVLVRNNGITAMQIVIAHAEGMGINCGKLPLVGAGEVDLSGFKK